MADISRIDLYLQQEVGTYYENTLKEQELINKFVALYSMSKSAQESVAECNPDNLDKWRRAYLGTLNALNQDGTESKRKSRQLRKLAYEVVESTVDNSIPTPKIIPQHKSDVPVVGITEEYLKYQAKNIFNVFLNDKSERSTYIDGTVWYKVYWDSLDNSHVRSGAPKIELFRVDQIVPQPGVTNYRQLEYIFERNRVSVSRLYDLYNRLIRPTDGTSMVDIVSCYFLNGNRRVGLFMWAENTLQVICNEEDWQVRKLRTCQMCGAVNPVADTCSQCGNSTFKYEVAQTDVLEEDLVEVYNPYDVGETEDPAKRKELAQRPFASMGTELPFYEVRMLPFVPRPAVSSIDSIYGMSEVRVLLELQDGANKVLTKAVDKTLKSGAVVTKPEKLKMSDTDDTFKVLGVRSSEEAAMVTTKQIVADTSQDILIANILYDGAKQASGITDSFQGRRDTTATSGKAKEFAAMQSAGRIQSMREIKSAALSGVYELIFKYLLAFSDAKQSFVRVLPDGSSKEEVWNKYMFLDKDKYGQFYYRDDFKFECDPASSLSQNRVQMWRETQEKFIQGSFGNPADPRTLKIYWNILDSLQYPLAKVALAGIAETEQHLPYAVEQALLANPEMLQTILQTVEGGQGGARSNSGPVGNGATHAANVERTNARNKASNKQIAFTGQQATPGAN